MIARLRDAGELIRFSHTVFALPFALIAALAAARGLPPPATIGWIIVAMVGARTAAMAFNRIADLASTPPTRAPPVARSRAGA